MRLNYFLVVLLAALAGCATTASGPSGAPAAEGGSGDALDRSAAQPAQAAARRGPLGTINIDLTTVVGDHVAGRVDLMDVEGNPPIRLDAPEGVLEAQVPTGEYRAYIHVFEGGVPVLVETQAVQVTRNAPGYVLLNLLEGASDRIALREFDFDGDLAINTVELASGTDPENAAEIPGYAQLQWASPVLGNESRWYKGELFAHSNHGRGKESVAALVKRAESAGLDFLAIADHNTMAAMRDPGFRSNSVVLLPAMMWGNDEMGYALIYGPRTMPDPPESMAAAQAQCIRVQAQGGVFAIAHPCLPAAPWRWGLSYVNAIQAWYRDWRAIPPLRVESLEPELRVRDDDGKYLTSIAAVASEAEVVPVSANSQATRFWDYELVRGLRAAGIAGSGAASRDVPLGQPITYVLAREKSAGGILEGLRMGRTIMAASPNGPMIDFTADINNDGHFEVGVGGSIPVGMDSMLEVTVHGAKDKKLQFILDGLPIVTKRIESDPFVQRLPVRPNSRGAYRVRVIARTENPEMGMGPIDVLAMTSPIYSEDMTRQFLQVLQMRQ